MSEKMIFRRHAGRLFASMKTHAGTTSGSMTRQSWGDTPKKALKSIMASCLIFRNQIWHRSASHSIFSAPIFTPLILSLPTKQNAVFQKLLFRPGIRFRQWTGRWCPSHSIGECVFSMKDTVYRWLSPKTAWQGMTGRASTSAFTTSIE